MSDTTDELRRQLRAEHEQPLLQMLRKLEARREALRAEIQEVSAEVAVVNRMLSPLRPAPKRTGKLGPRSPQAGKVVLAREFILAHAAEIGPFGIKIIHEEMSKRNGKASIGPDPIRIAIAEMRDKGEIVVDRVVRGGQPVYKLASEVKTK